MSGSSRVGTGNCRIWRCSPRLTSAHGISSPERTGAIIERFWGAHDAHCPRFLWQSSSCRDDVDRVGRPQRFACGGGACASPVDLSRMLLEGKNPYFLTRSSWRAVWRDLPLPSHTSSELPGFPLMLPALHHHGSRNVETAVGRPECGVRHWSCCPTARLFKRISLTCLALLGLLDDGNASAQHDRQWPTWSLFLFFFLLALPARGPLLEWRQRAWLVLAPFTITRAAHDCLPSGLPVVEHCLQRPASTCS